MMTIPFFGPLPILRFTLWVPFQLEPSPWNYKTQGRQYDAAGNFNYGATGAEAGIP